MNVVAEVKVRSIRKVEKRRDDGKVYDVTEIQVEQKRADGSFEDAVIQAGNGVSFEIGDTVNMEIFPRAYAVKDRRSGDVRSGIKWYLVENR